MGSFSGRMRHWGQLALANPLAFVATLTLGALLAFTYSYVPLHTVKDRKLERLERTVLEQELALVELQEEQQNLRTRADEESDDGALAALESDRDQAKRDIASVRAELGKVQKKSKRIERERNDWKRKVAQLEQELEEVAALEVVEATPAPLAADTAAEAGTESSAVAGAAPPAADVADPSDAGPAAPAP